MKKERIYTVQEMEEGIPRIMLRGKWLDSVGLGIGTKLKYVEGKNMIILMKIPEKTIEENNRNKKIHMLEGQINALNREAAV